MKGVNLPTALISVMVGVFLVFAVIIPISYNGVYGTLTEETSVTNTSTALGSMYVNYTVSDCTPIRDDVTWLTVVNSSDTTDDHTDEFTVTDDTNGVLKFTNTTDYGDVAPTFDIDYRCYDSGYITDGTARNVASFIPVLVIVLILVGLAGLMYFKND